MLERARCSTWRGLRERRAFRVVQIRLEHFDGTVASHDRRK
jgi:hypothetical protein